MWVNIGLLIISSAFLIQNKRYRWFYILWKTYKRDLTAGIRYAQLGWVIWLWKRQNKTTAEAFSSLVKKHPQKVAFYFENTTWTFSQVDEFSNQIARYLDNQGFHKGDIIAVLLENSHEYPCVWLGLSKIGAVGALINTNLLNDPLIHSIQVANSKAIIFGSNYAEAIKNIQEKIKTVKLYQFHETIENSKTLLTEATDLRKELESISKTPVDKKFQSNIKDPLIYIYTSGTTGLPKAAVITNIRFIYMVLALHYMANISANDIIYDPLPLYHTAGGMLGVGQTFLSGTALVIRKKFSASNYWKECAKYNCTIAQYIGEICRYILIASGNNVPIKHSVKSIFGNGMRQQIWNEFVNKFEIENVIEFYGSTEGISNLINIDSAVGSIGFVPRYAKWLYPMILIKCNQSTGDPIRNKEGFCIECDVDEPGLAIGKIIPKRGGSFTFQGYSDSKATEKKILQNVFRNGDTYFNSGDILVCDEFGYYFFKDRTGDTFRWKGENVSTSEVEAIISNIVQLNDAVVYGVQIPGTEGRAGMAAIVDTKNSLDINALSVNLKNNLPSYSVPLFIRIMESVPLTGTFKLKKIELQEEGYDINKIKDKLYFYNNKLGKYILLTKELYDEIISSKLNL